MKTSAFRTIAITLSSASCAALLMANAAHADRRAAPITYPDASKPAQASIVAPVVSQPNTAITPDRRIEFNYPTAGTVVAAKAPARNAPTSAPFLAPSNQTNIADALAAAPAEPIRIASVKAQETARTGKPLTLSRVRANRDAKIGEERGRAGIYTEGFDGQPTANGEIFDETAMTAAHPSLPLPSLVQVINEDNSREVVVRVNDRGPFDGKRVLELSPRAGSVLGMAQGGAANVRIRYLGPAPVQQNPETYASVAIEDEALPPVVSPPPQSIFSQAAPPVVAAPAPSYERPTRVANMTVSAPVSAGNVFIQAGAFSDIANAQRLTSSLGGNLPVKIEEARVNGGDFFRVLIGPFQNHDSAERERSTLSRTGVVDGFLTTR